MHHCLLVFLLIFKKKISPTPSFCIFFKHVIHTIAYSCNDISLFCFIFMILCFCINCFDSFTQCCLCKFCVFSCSHLCLLLWSRVTTIHKEPFPLAINCWSYHSIFSYCNYFTQFSFVQLLLFYPRIKVNGLNLKALCDFLDFIKYDDDKWVENFRMTKSFFFTLLTNCNVCCWNKTSIIKKLSLLKYICCVIYKLAHGAHFFVCSEFFTLSKLISKVFHDLWQL